MAVNQLCVCKVHENYWLH